MFFGIARALVGALFIFVVVSPSYAAENFSGKGPAFALEIGSEAIFKRVGFWEVVVSNGIMTIEGKWVGKNIPPFPGRIVEATREEKQLANYYAGKIGDRAVSTMNGKKPAKIDMSQFFVRAQKRTVKVLAFEFQERRDVVFVGNDGRARVFSFPRDGNSKLGHVYGLLLDQ